MNSVPSESLIYYGLEYKFVTLHAIGELSYDEMHHQLEIAIHQFAKRQMTWFRGMSGEALPFIGLTRPSPWSKSSIGHFL